MAITCRKLNAGTKLGPNKTKPDAKGKLKLQLQLQLVRLPPASHLRLFCFLLSSVKNAIFTPSCSGYCEENIAPPDAAMKASPDTDAGLSALCPWTHLLPLLRYQINFYALLPQQW